MGIRPRTWAGYGVLARNLVKISATAAPAAFFLFMGFSSRWLGPRVL
jgi:hypothetical protein